MWNAPKTKREQNSIVATSLFTNFESFAARLELEYGFCPTLLALKFHVQISVE